MAMERLARYLRLWLHFAAFYCFSLQLAHFLRLPLEPVFIGFYREQ